MWEKAKTFKRLILIIAEILEREKREREENGGERAYDEVIIVPPDMYDKITPPEDRGVCIIDLYGR